MNDPPPTRARKERAEHAGLDERYDERHGGLDDMWGLLAFILLVLVAIGAIWLIRSLTREARPRHPAPPVKPEEILRRRYAAGEIDEEEYLRRLSGLDQN